MYSMKISHGVRSLLHFGVFVVFALGATLFILEKAEKAIAEIEALNDSQVFVLMRTMSTK